MQLGQHTSTGAPGEPPLRGEFERLPLIDISGLASPDLAFRKRTARELDHAARSSGFFYVTEHGLARDLSEGLLHAIERFFGLPEAVKQRYYIGDSRNHRGYVPPGEETFYAGSKDTKEAFDLSLELPANDPDYVAGNRLLGPNRWPLEMPEFRLLVYAYYEAVVALGRRLLRGLALALEAPEDIFDEKLVKPPSQLRLIHYPAQPEESDRPGIGAHTDYECFTILLATSPGLEVLNAAGRWIDAPPIPGAFVINIGDLFEVLSNGRWVSTSHRVRRVCDERYSAPLFFNLDYHTEIAPLAHLVERDGVARYPSFRAGEHLFAQTAQSFGYLRREIERGELELPDNLPGKAAFLRDRSPADAAAQGAPIAKVTG
jgi:isopenicillin N synthase-like dioxygenase